MDHDRVNISASPMSCGVMELGRISDEIEAAVYAIASRLYHPSRGAPCAFLIWSEVATEEPSNFVKFIGNNHLGILNHSNSAENPRTSNFIRIYIWQIWHDNFKKWYSIKRQERVRKVGA